MAYGVVHGVFSQNLNPHLPPHPSISQKYPEIGTIRSAPVPLRAEPLKRLSLLSSMNEKVYIYEHTWIVTHYHCLVLARPQAGQRDRQSLDINAGGGHAVADVGAEVASKGV